MSLQGQRTTTTAMEWDDFKSVIAKLERDKEYKFCILIAAGVFTGLRISDLLKLQWRDLEKPEIIVVKEKKTTKHRSIKVNEDLAALARRIRQKLGNPPEDELIFINRWKTKAIDKNYVNRKLKKILDRYGIVLEGNASTHLFRKTLGNRVLKLYNYAPEAIYLLMDLFEHSSPLMTKRYLGIRQREIHDIYDKLRL